MKTVSFVNNGLTDLCPPMVLRVSSFQWYAIDFYRIWSRLSSDIDSPKILKEKKVFDYYFSS